MELFFIENYSVGQELIALSVEESRHVQKVLRKRSEEEIQLTDGNGTLLLARIKGEQDRRLQLSVTEPKKFPFPSKNNITLAISIIRPNRMDWAVEKATELGIKKIVPLYCHYGIFRNLKLDHLKRVAVSAIKQSGQVYLPEISPPLSLSEWIEKSVQEKCNRLIALPDTEGRWSDSAPNLKNNKYQLLIGSEGGFHTDEIKKAIQHHFHPLHLGPTTLRTETAAITGITLLKSHM
jgi:16S rRNA (uracil1498-N3)-methyltransferase